MIGVGGRFSTLDYRWVLIPFRQVHIYLLVAYPEDTSFHLHPKVSLDDLMGLRCGTGP